MFGERVRFEHEVNRFNEWKNGLSENRPIGYNQIGEKGNNASSQVGVQVSALGILKVYPQFVNIQALYRKKGYLEPSHRKLISNLICDFLISNGIDWQPRRFKEISEQLVEMFPTEVKETYYLQIKNKKAGGVLCCRYRNSLAKRRVLESTVNIEDDGDEPADEENDNYNNNAKYWLKCNVAPLNIVKEHWEHTFSERKLSIQTGSKNLNAILEEWPILRQSFGHELISRDFELKYPETIIDLETQWSTFRSKFLQLSQERVKENYSLEILKKLKTDLADDDQLNIATITILHAILKPTARKVVKKGNNEKIGVKVTIQDSRQSFFAQFSSSAELESAIKEKIEEQLKCNECLQPIICGIGPTVLEATEFFVYYADIYYKFTNILSAIESCFKLFYVLDLKYPESCKLVWLFFQEYFFNFKLSDKDIHPSVKSLINDLK
ncbi:uncharacterized protein [Drosophila takahashii]|uniref:uncharacterized protein n=1 Tax=Drosophila takahashii TaxID=29030 RepID=UPI003898E03A